MPARVLGAAAFTLAAPAPPAGRHRIEIRRAGEVEIQPGEETPLNVRLDESR